MRFLFEKRVFFFFFITMFFYLWGFRVLMNLFVFLYQNLSSFFRCGKKKKEIFLGILNFGN